ncbi:DUF3347 domain-containing protein [Chitinophaga filiformis]|uniref:DUF3347 domain-containing protein n=1 Tax=Chitinophaga filiformis TaxID=104663 RepID=UPI001F2C8C83|nr:DUF3347 domain-containing protein [Chitinophaga filiformis]MCF6407058.1 DUF3347 domain-containing protein [Chitinophaga filiformis]
MKSLIIATTILLATFSAKAANPSLSQLLSLYYDVKNALVNSDAGTASAKAAEFIKVINSVDMHALSAEEHKAFMPLSEKLTADATAIAKSADLSAQREKFKTFSNNIFILAKAVKLSDTPVYQQYCPMQKSYWLSGEAAVKNPYYGKQMLSCGKVTETIK